MVAVLEVLVMAANFLECPCGERMQYQRTSFITFTEDGAGERSGAVAISADCKACGRRSELLIEDASVVGRLEESRLALAELERRDARPWWRRWRRWLLC